MLYLFEFFPNLKLMLLSFWTLRTTCIKDGKSPKDTNITKCDTI